MRRFLRVASGVLLAVLFVAALVGTLAVLGGCASLPDGVTMTDDERAACKANGCSVWIDSELEGFAKRFLIEGYKRGRAAEKGRI